VALEYASGGACLPCAAGTTSAAPADGVTAADGDTTCEATICAVDEYVFANTCVACAEGTENPLSGDEAAGDDASGSNTACTAVPITGMCVGNTDDADDVTCAEGSLLKPDPETVEGSTVGDCCDEVEEDAPEPEVEYQWEADAWGVCAFQCGASTVERTVQCTAITIYSNGAVTRAVADDPTSCEGDAPATTMDCRALESGAACDDDDGNVGACSDAGACVGKQVLKSALTFPVAAEDVALPEATATPEEITASPIGVALSASIKSSLEATLGSDIIVAILSIQAGSLVVDYNVEVPSTVTVDASAAATALEAGLTSTPPTLPAADGGAGTVSAGTAYVEPFKTYAYSRTAGCAAASDCSNACGFEGETAADVYRCLEDGAAVAAEACVDAGIGAAPTSDSTCCPAADVDTCVASAAALTAPPPCPENYRSDPDLSAEEKARCGWAELEEKTEGNAAVVIVIVIVVALALLALAYKLCCSDSDDSDSNDSRGDVEKGAAVEAQENEEERRKKLEDRLAKVRDTIDEAP
jgi:hypothetical protein